MLIGARTGAWAKSGGGIPTAASYVQDGLIAMWDGIENAGWGTHDSTLRTWIDLSGNGHDATFTQGNVSPLFNPDGAWGSDCYIFPNTCACAEVSMIFGPSCTIESCFSNRQKVSSYWANYDTKDDAIAFFYESGGIRSFYLKSGHRVYDSGIGINEASGTYSQVENTGRSQMYFNGIGTYVVVAYSQSPETKTFAISGPYASNFFTGNIHCTRIYNRALSDLEIVHNRTIDQQRFNQQ